MNYLDKIHYFAIFGLPLLLINGFNLILGGTVEGAALNYFVISFFAMTFIGYVIYLLHNKWLPSFNQRHLLYAYTITFIIILIIELLGAYYFRFVVVVWDSIGYNSFKIILFGVWLISGFVGSVILAKEKNTARKIIAGFKGAAIHFIGLALSIVFSLFFNVIWFIAKF